MADNELRVKFWGVRGSLPVSGADFSEFGGNTISLEISSGQETLLFDAGSGLPLVGRALAANPPAVINLFMSHFHYDHIIGLPFFCPLFMPQASVAIWSGNMGAKATTRQMLREIMKPPFFPVSPDICPARIACNDFVAGAVLEPMDGVTVRTGMLNHPGGAIGYRIEWKDRVIAVITDTEHVVGELDQTVLDLIRDADLFIYDGAFDESEMTKYKGFGHSSWQQAVKLSRAAGVKQAAVFHHAPIRTDAALNDMERRAQAEMPSLFFARDLQTLTL